MAEIDARSEAMSQKIADADLQRKIEFAEAKANIETDAKLRKQASAEKQQRDLLEQASKEALAHAERAERDRQRALEDAGRAAARQAEQDQKAAARQAEQDQKAAARQAENLSREVVSAKDAENATSQLVKPTSSPGVDTNIENSALPVSNNKDENHIKPSQGVKHSPEAQKPTIVKASKLRTPNFLTPKQCQKCGTGEHLRKWSGIVASQTSLAETKGKAVTDRGLFRNDYVTEIRTETHTSTKLASRYPEPKAPQTYLWMAYAAAIGGTTLGSAGNPTLLYGSIPIGLIAVAMSLSKGRKQSVQNKLQAHFDAIAKFENTWYCAKCDYLFSVTK